MQSPLRIVKGRVRTSGLVLALSVLLVPILLPAQENPDQQSQLYAQMTRGYAAVAENPAEAISIFEEIVRDHATNVQARRQLGSLYVSAGRTEEALEQFRASDTLCPSDTTKLQIAYLLTVLSRPAEARSTFAALEGSTDPEIRAQATKAAGVLNWTVQGGSDPWWGRFCGDPFYDSRFNNSVFRFWLVGGKYLSESRTVSAYVQGIFTRDTRSSGGAVPVIYSDSYSLTGAGLRVQPFSGGTFDLQAGVAIGLVDQAGDADVRGDLRVLASYGWGRYPDPESPERLRMCLKPFVEATGMGGYYSRYHNVLGFGHGKAGVRSAEWGRAYLELYVRADGVADTRREYYNNILEGSLGLRLVPDFAWGVQILAEYHRGLYWDGSLPTSPYDRWYSSGRLMIVFDQPFAL
jgi:hypothetical protein